MTQPTDEGKFDVSFAHIDTTSNFTACVGNDLQKQCSDAQVDLLSNCLLLLREAKQRVDDLRTGSEGCCETKSEAVCIIITSAISANTSLL